MKRLATAALLLCGWFVLGGLTAPPALAHAELVSTSPAENSRLGNAPSEVRLQFSESVSIDFGHVRVSTVDGDRVDSGSPEHPNGEGSIVAVGLEPGLGDGSYIVSWRVLSADSHPINGAFSFVVGDGPLVPPDESQSTEANADTAVDTLFAASRWAGFAGLVLLVGGGVFLITCWPKGFGQRRPQVILWVGWAILAATTLVAIPLQGLYASGIGLTHFFDTRVLDATLTSTFGRLASARLLLVAVLGLMLSRVIRVASQGRASSDSERGWEVDVGALAAIGTLVTYAGSGHASAGIQPPVAILSDTIHLAAMAVWVGGLAILSLTLLPQRQLTDLFNALPRFSRLAIGCVVTLIITGAYQTWREVGTPPALWNTDYGQLLIVKLSAVALFVTLGFISRSLVQRRLIRRSAVRPSIVDRDHPRLAQLTTAENRDTADGREEPATQGNSSFDRSVLRRLRSSVAIEVIIAAVILGITAVLVAEPPARASYSEPYAATLSLGDGGNVRIHVTPAESGTNSVEITVRDSGDEPFDPQEITATAALPAHNLGPIDIDLADAGVGRFTASTLLPHAGTWELVVSVRTSEFDRRSVTAEVSVK